MNYIVSLSVLGASLALLAGCNTSSVWENEFRRGEAKAAPLSDGSSIVVREVPWNRVQDTLADINEKLAKNDKHYDDWSQSDKNRLKAQLLRGLQVSESPEDVELLGRSEFRTTDRIRPDDGTLESFARKVGANTVIITTAYVGSAETVRQEAITEYRTGNTSRRHSDDRNRDTTSEMSTMWVPMMVHADENAYIAFFLHKK